MTGFLQAALAYAARGVPVFPCAPRGKLPAIRKSPDAAEGWRGNGVSDACTDPALIEAWWTRLPTANIGLACGHGVWVADIDGPAAAAWIRNRVERFGEPLPQTAAVQTRGGFHLYFTGDAPPKNGAPAKVRRLQGDPPGKDGYLRPPGFDVRVRGGYVLAPPSIHPSGAVYDWMISRDGVVLDLEHAAPAPAWLLEALTPLPVAEASAAGPRARRPLTGNSVERAAQAYLNKVCEAIAAAPLGQRHQTLRDGALKVGGLVKQGHLTLSEARAAIEAAGREGSARHGGRWDQSRMNTLEDSLANGNPWSPGGGGA